jgi:serine phosphatase RsbU (regulator of sigma subunit)
MKQLVFAILAITCSLISGTCYAQGSPDSLDRILEIASSDTMRFRILKQMVPDLIAASDTINKEKLIARGLELAEDLNKLVEFNELIALSYEHNKDYLKAIDYYLNEMKEAEKQSQKQKVAWIYKQMGNNYYDAGDFGKSLDNYFKSRGNYETIRDSAGMAATYNNIANIYFRQEDFGKALEYNNKSLGIEKQMNDPAGLASCYLNIGVTKRKIADGTGNMADYDSALVVLQKGIQIYQRINNKPGIAQSYINVANIYDKKNVPDSVMNFYEKARSIYEELGDKRGLAETYLSIGVYYKVNLEYKKAIEYLLKGYDLAMESRRPELVKEVAYNLSYLFARTNDFEKAYSFHVKYKQAEDYVNSEANVKMIAQREMKYMLDRQENERLAEKKRQAIKTLFFIVALSFFIILAIVIFRSYRMKRRDNILLAQQKEEIAAQRDEIEAQRDKVMQQRDQIVRQKEEITDSILYARRIQNAILPPEEFRKSILPENFILNKPRDIVSGDFYWMAKIDHKVIAVAADCTGHGVPGAFMSMLGVTFLNEIVNKGAITDPGQILNQLREYIIRALHQTGKEGENKDGMDISLAVIDQKNNVLEFAGAYNALYLVRDSEVIEVKADRMPIGIYLEKNEQFKTQTMPLQKGDSMYMLSDGYVDQFGGTEGKKLKAKAFKELILTIRDLPMEAQQKKLDENIVEWMGQFAQVDDILVIGIRV